MLLQQSAFLFCFSLLAEPLHFYGSSNCGSHQRRHTHTANITHITTTKIKILRKAAQCYIFFIIQIAYFIIIESSATRSKRWCYGMIVEDIRTEKGIVSFQISVSRIGKLQALVAILYKRSSELDRFPEWFVCGTVFIGYVSKSDWRLRKIQYQIRQSQFFFSGNKENTFTCLRHTHRSGIQPEDLHLIA